MSDRYLSLKQVRAETSLSTATIYRLVDRGELARQHQLSPNRVGWLASDVAKFLASRPLAPARGTPQPARN